MAEFVTLNPSTLKELHEVNPALLSYNIEFAEVTGGTFWKAYTPAQIAGTEPFGGVDMSGGIAAAYKDLMQVYPPINLYDEKLRKLAKAFGTQWVRVSGTWATKTYYDFDGKYAPGQVPEGYLNVLTRAQWVGVLDFVKAVGAKLMVSVSGCPGVYGCNSAPVPAWTPREAEKLFRFSKEYGVPISGSEFINEPNLLEGTGFPKGYTAEDHARDQRIFVEWLHNNYPEVIYIGPGSVGEAGIGKKAGGVEQLMKVVSTADLMGKEPAHLDVFSYHYYNGVSERLAGVMPAGHWNASEANSEAYLAVASDIAKVYVPVRDTYCPGGEMWVTESGDAGGGGDTWASTYLDVIRTLNEAGSFSEVTDGVIFHNTLAASDYAYLDRITHDPRPNYFAVLLWRRLMGNTVYATGEAVRMGAHVFAHSRADGKPGTAWLVINNSETETTTVSLPVEAERYTLAGLDGKKRATVMTLNDQPLVLGEDITLPEMKPVTQPAGEVKLAPMTCTFFVM